MDILVEQLTVGRVFLVVVTIRFAWAFGSYVLDWCAHAIDWAWERYSPHAAQRRLERIETDVDRKAGRTMRTIGL